MAEGLNRVLLLGNLGADPELKMTNSGQAVLKMRLATTESYLDRNKVRQDRTEWHQVVVWGRRAEALSKFLTKGSRLFVEGGLRTSSYEDRDGNKRYKTEIVANNVILAGGGGGGRGGGQAPARGDDSSAPDDAGAAPPAPDDAAGFGGGYDGGDDIPF